MLAVLSFPCMMVAIAVGSCLRTPKPCSEADVAARVATTVAAVELLADALCNADRASCPVAQAGLRKLASLDTECAGIGGAP